MNCDQCGKETNVLSYAVNHVDEMDLCADCFSQFPTHLEVQAITTPNCTGEVTVEFSRPESVAVNFHEETPILFDYTEIAEISFGDPPNDLGPWLNAVEITRRPFGRERLMVINNSQRRKIKDRFKTMRITQRQQLAAKDAIIEQLRERLDRAKRERSI